MKTVAFSELSTCIVVVYMLKANKNMLVHKPMLCHLFLSIPPENIRKSGFWMLSGGIGRIQWYKMG